MRALIVGNPVFDTHYSIQAFQATLSEGLRRFGWEVDVANAGSGRRIRPGYLPTRFEKFLRFPQAVRRMSASYDLVHLCEHGYASYARWSLSRATTVTCHDLIVAKAARGEVADWPLTPRTKAYQESILRDLRRFDRIVCVSETTKGDVLRMSKPDPQRLEVIYNGFYRPLLVSDREQAAVHLRAAGLSGTESYFVNVSGDQPNKNRSGLLAIYAELQRRLKADAPWLVIVGAKLSEAHASLVAGLPEPTKVRNVVRPSDEVVQALLTGATMLIYPSRYEGFGLPIIEAQRQGCAVATTGWGPMDEVAGPGAVLFDPGDPMGAAETIIDGLGRREEIVEAGNANIARFSPERMVKGYDTLFRSLVGAS